MQEGIYGSNSISTNTDISTKSTGQIEKHLTFEQLRSKCFGVFSTRQGIRDNI